MLRVFREVVLGSLGFSAVRIGCFQGFLGVGLGFLVFRVFRA